MSLFDYYLFWTTSITKIVPKIWKKLRSIFDQLVEVALVKAWSSNFEWTLLLGQSSPDTLATLVLKSSTFRQFKSNKILSQIRENDIENPIHALAFVILSVEQGGAKTKEDLEKSRQEPINNRT